MNGTARAVVLLLLLAGWARTASAQVGPPSVDLGDASLADLMKIEITSASHKEQRLFDTAAASATDCVAPRDGVSEYLPRNWSGRDSLRESG